MRMCGMVQRLLFWFRLRSGYIGTDVVVEVRCILEDFTMNLR